MLAKEALTQEQLQTLRGEALQTLADLRILFARKGREGLIVTQYEHEYESAAQLSLNTVRFVMEKPNVAEYLKATGTKVKIVGGKIKSGSYHSHGVYAVVDRDYPKVATKSGDHFSSIGHPLGSDAIWEDWHIHNNRGWIKSLARMSEVDIVDRFRVAIDGPKAARVLKRLLP